MDILSFIGPEKLKLFNNIDTSTLLPNVDVGKVQCIQSLWTKFFRMNSILSKASQDIQEEEIALFGEQAKDWVKAFIQIYQTKRVTPYMHAFQCHVGEFLKLYGSLKPFTQQGLVNYNDKVTKTFFRYKNTCT